MKQRMCFGWITAICLLILLPFNLTAQTGNSPERAYTVRVAGLTSAQRDDLQRELKGRNDLKLVFACVPAGVLVFEPAIGETRQHAAQRIAPLLEAKALRQRTEELAGGLASAEDACEQARNR
ncbi:MAG TPA: hypothetical protein PKY96_03675 [Flavobacteriales bacterium]|nr:hypothetical protein [Flavobacteriales bacterium]